MTPSVPLLPLSKQASSLLERYGARPSDLYRALANQPQLLETWVQAAWELRQRCVLPRSLRELVILHAAHLQGSSYVWRDHVQMARDSGVSPGQIDALSRWAASAEFDDSTRAALLLTEEMVSGRVTDSTLAEVANHFEAAERVELFFTVGFYCMTPRILEAFRLTGAEMQESE